MPCERRTRHRFQASFRWMNSCIFWRLGFRQSSFHQYHAGLSVHRSIRLDTITDLLPGCCSLCLSTPGEASGPRMFLRILPGYAGDTTGRFVAHHAIVPFTFQIQVSHQIQRYCISSHLCPLRGRYNAAPRGAAEPERDHGGVDLVSTPAYKLVTSGVPTGECLPLGAGRCAAFVMVGDRGCGSVVLRIGSSHRRRRGPSGRRWLGAGGAGRRVRPRVVGRPGW